MLYFQKLSLACLRRWRQLWCSPFPVTLQRIFNTGFKKLSLVVFCCNFWTHQQKPHDYMAAKIWYIKNVWFLLGHPVCVTIHISQKPQPKFRPTKFSLRATCVTSDHNTLCASGFVDDLMFFRNATYTLSSGTEVCNVQFSCSKSHDSTASKWADVHYRLLCGVDWLMIYYIQPFSCNTST